MDTPSHCYLGTRPCGCFGFIAGDVPELAQEIAQDAAWLIAAGGKMERLPLQDGRDACADMPARCDTCGGGEAP